MHKIIGIGNAIVDFFVKVDDSFFAKNNLVKGSMSLVDENFVKANINLKFEKFCSGGSIGNSIANLALLGSSVEFIGNVGNDHTGKLFIEQIKNKNCKFCNNKAQEWHHIKYETDSVIALCSNCHEKI